MACFTVPAAEAVVTTVIYAAAKHKEKAAQKVTVETGIETEGKIPFSKKIGWLNTMLWGGSALLAFEHLWHGEITPFFPFLTAAADPQSAVTMLKEMATVGVGMALTVTAAWLCMLGVCRIFEKRGKSVTAKNGKA